MEYELDKCAKLDGAYVISLLACDRVPLPKHEEEAKRGGTGPIQDPGQGITIHAAQDGCWITPDTPSLAQEFLQQLEESKAPNGCIMLPGNLQYWQPCKCKQKLFGEIKGTIGYNINEPIHFAGPSP